ncbi:MAG TPA: hypothetical protein VN137_09100 [Sphingomonas sp.]|nr:hypothetical protein [Sphingomonas sp.]
MENEIACFEELAAASERVLQIRKFNHASPATLATITAFYGDHEDG